MMTVSRIFALFVVLLLAFCAGLQAAHLWPGAMRIWVSRGWLVFDIAGAVVGGLWVVFALRRID